MQIDLSHGYHFRSGQLVVESGQNKLCRQGEVEKINQKNPLFITLQDKYNVNEYVASRDANAALVLYATEDPKTIPFDTLPDKYLIKANHGWGWNILCFESRWYSFLRGQNLVNEDGSFLNARSAAKYEISKADVVKRCCEWLGSKHHSDEWACQHINPRIVVEELLEPSKGKQLIDYRMYAFDGVVKVIQADLALMNSNAQTAFFTPDWIAIDLTSYKESFPDSLPQKPSNLEDLIAVAERLGKGTDFVRVDLYNTTRGAVLGEMTVYPEAGRADTPTSCPVFNQWLGDQWKLKNADAIRCLYWHLSSRGQSLFKRFISKCSLPRKA